ncbi:hypothetical protein D3C80_2147970 [compost metagenome]
MVGLAKQPVAGYHHFQPAFVISLLEQVGTGFRLLAQHVNPVVFFDALEVR